MSIIIDSKLKPGLAHNFHNILTGLKFVPDGKEDNVIINNKIYKLFCNNPTINKEVKQEIIIADEKKKDIVIGNMFYINLVRTYFAKRIKPFILKEIKRFKKRHFNENVISLHIRTWNSSTNNDTNNQKAHARSKVFKLSQWVNIINNEKYRNKRFFVAIDDENMKPKLKKKFGDRVFFYERNGNNEINKYTLVEKQLIYDFIEMYLLSQSKVMIGGQSGFFRFATFFANETTEIRYI
jgi:hypothetical protein